MKDIKLRPLYTEIDPNFKITKIKDIDPTSKKKILLSGTMHFSDSIENDKYKMYTYDISDDTGSILAVVFSEKDENNFLEGINEFYQFKVGGIVTTDIDAINANVSQLFTKDSMKFTCDRLFLIIAIQQVEKGSVD